MSSVTVWTRRDPFAQFNQFDQSFNTIVRRAFGPGVSTRRVVRPSGFVPAADLTRDGDDAVLRLELPGVDVAKDVTVELDHGRLSIKGEKRGERDGAPGYREARYGSFARTFSVSEHVTADAVSASYDAGVLSVRVTGVYAEPESTATQIAVTSAETASAETASAEDAS